MPNRESYLRIAQDQADDRLPKKLKQQNAKLRQNSASAAKKQDIMLLTDSILIAQGRHHYRTTHVARKERSFFAVGIRVLRRWGPAQDCV